jgi:hypothetical protein
VAASLLVEEDAAGPQRSVQQAEGVNVTPVARRHREHRPLAGLAVARGAQWLRLANGAVAVADACWTPWLACHGLGDPKVLLV